MDISILCITYNHVKYIRKTLEGFLMQKGNFEYEILIHDDASTDGTIEILKEYKEKYPDKITLIIQEENQYSKGLEIVALYLLPLVKGKYIAFCEGDDLWIYKKKLQRQYEWMEAHPNTSMCIHNAVRINLDENDIVPQIFDMDSGYVEDREIFQCRRGRIPTASFFFRTEHIKQLPNSYYTAPVGDDPLRFLCASYGKIYYMDKVWSIRNFMHDGSWNKRMSNDMTFQLDYYKKYLRFLMEFNNETNHYFDICIKELCLSHCMFLINQKNQAPLFCQELEETICYWKKEMGHLLDDILDMAEILKRPECEDYLKYVKNRLLCSGKIKKLYIYGAGQIAKSSAEILIDSHIDFHGFVVSSKEDEMTGYMGHPVYDIHEIYGERESCYWLCMNYANRAEVLPLLYSLEIKEIL